MLLLLAIPFVCAQKNFPEYMFQLFREILKPAFAYLSNRDFREWIMVKGRCKNKTAGTPVTFRISGFTVSGNDAASFSHQYEEIFVNRSFETKFTKNNPLIYCCGANIGLEIFFFKKQFPQCRIKAFEADPAIAKILSENVLKNRFSDVETISSAVWTENGSISFTSDGALGGKTGEGNSAVNTIRLADELSKENSIDLLIMDIEGAELEVLKNCRAQLDKVEHLFVEWHGNANEPQNLEKLLLLLTESGFRYRLNNKLNKAPFSNGIVENGFDAMVEIYASRK
jgi:FkbM family methyltransferase